MTQPIDYSGQNPKPARPTHQRGSLLWKMIGLALIVHVVVLVVASPSLMSSRKDSVDQLYERGETAMKDGHYVEAMQLYEHVMEQQPKPPAVFERAAEQHRVAERMAKQQAAKTTTQNPATQETKSDKPAVVSPTAKSPAATPTNTKAQPATKTDPNEIPAEFQKKP